MSEPTYRVELAHDPTEPEVFQWSARVIRLSDESQMCARFGASREEAFAGGQSWIQMYHHAERQAPSEVYLTEDGSILDPHEVQR